MVSFVSLKGRCRKFNVKHVGEECELTARLREILTPMMSMAHWRGRVQNLVAAMLRDGRAAACAGERAKAQRRFRIALMFQPANVDALLWLAWLSGDRHKSLTYLARALSCEPRNPRVHTALCWAHQRALSASPSALPVPLALVSREPIPYHGKTGRVHSGFVLFAILSLLVVLGIGAFGESLLGGRAALAALDSSPLGQLSVLPSVTVTVLAGSTSPTLLRPTQDTVLTLTRSLDRSPTPIAVSVLTFTPEPGATCCTPTPVNVSLPTPISTPVVTPRSDLPDVPPSLPTVTSAPLPVRSDGNVRWIDVNLTHQRLSAYEGERLVRTTLVATGLPRTPTPTGRYHIWVKLRYDDMSGAGYYLPDVPYVMYFYGGYGLHGADWHTSFGQPMSHGCINLPMSEAEWLFDWVDVGTMVNIHH